MLFDYDGTLVKSPLDNFRAWHRVMSEYDIDLKPSEFYPYEGMKLQQMGLQFFRGNVPPGIDPAELVKKKDQYYLEDHTFAFYDGVTELLGSLKKYNIPFALVTAAIRDRIERSAPKDFLSLFSAIVTGDQLSRGKPHPDPYLKGAELLGVKPSECIVVENAPLGIDSAKAAGCYCIGVTTTLERSYLEKANEVVGSFSRIEKLDSVQRLFGEALGQL